MAKDAHPLAFAAAEAIADHAQAGLVIWESMGVIQWRTFPVQSVAVLMGMYELMGHAIDALNESRNVEDDDDPA